MEIKKNSAGSIVIAPEVVEKIAYLKAAKEEIAARFRSSWVWLGSEGI